MYVEVDFTMLIDFNRRKKHDEAQAQFLSPVNHIPGHRQHASHPGAAHHPATHKQSSDVDSLQAEDGSDVEVDWLHNILKEETETSGFDPRQGQNNQHGQIENSA